MMIETTVTGLTSSFGIYNSAGTTLLINSGALANVAAINNILLGATVTLGVGDYILAWTSSNGTPMSFRSMSTQTLINAINNTQVARISTAANASVAGVLPATLGALTALDGAVPIVKLQS